MADNGFEQHGELPDSSLVEDDRGTIVPKASFSDPTEERIYQQLRRLVGEGPATFWRDACEMMSNRVRDRHRATFQLATTTHIVAHCAREVKSSMLDVVVSKANLFKCPTCNCEIKRDEESDRNRIAEALRIMEAPSDDSFIEAWDRIRRGFHRYAHRSSLARPRPVDDDFREWWSDATAVFDHFLDRLQKSYALMLRGLDDLLAEAEPTRQHARKLGNSFPNNYVCRDYFFERAASNWLVPLRAEGFFREPPVPVYDEELRSAAYSPWPESRFLSKVAESAPHVVAEIIEQIPNTENPYVLADLLDAALAMPAEHASKIVSCAESWCRAQFDLFLGQKLVGLVVKLVQGGNAKDGLRLFGAMFEVLPTENAEAHSFRIRESHTRCDLFAYAELLSVCLPEVMKATGADGLRTICDLLDTAIRFEQPEEQSARAWDLSEHWCKHIGKSFSHHAHDVREVLVTAVANAAWIAMSEALIPIDGVLEALRRYPYTVFLRIELHLLKEFPGRATSAVKERLTSRQLLYDDHVHREYIDLLGAGFGSLGADDRRRILDWIDQWRPPDGWKEVFEHFTGRAPDDRAERHRIGAWQRRRLAAIVEYLDDDWRHRFAALADSLGTPEGWNEDEGVSVSWVTDESPKSVAELLELSVVDLVGYLGNWDGRDRWGQPSIQGLWNAVKEAAKSAPEHFIGELESFQNTAVAQYISTLLWGLRDAQPARWEASWWEPLLGLVSWVVQQRKAALESPSFLDEGGYDWHSPAMEAASCLSAGLYAGPNELPIALRPSVWDIAHGLIRVRDTNPEDRRPRDEAARDYLTEAINSVTGKAMEVVIDYALWVRRTAERQADANDRIARGFGEMPEVREVLDDYLDAATLRFEPVRAIYGLYLPWLCLLDARWLEANKHKLFPHEDADESLRRAAWEPYITHRPVYPGVFGILADEYEWVVRDLSRDAGRTVHGEKPAERLSEHIMELYWRGLLKKEGMLQLLDAFFEFAPQSLRRHALSYVGQTLWRSEGVIPAETIDRLRALWEKRAKAEPETAKVRKDRGELSGFGYWFASKRFDPAWSLEQLDLALHRCQRVAGEQHVIEVLAEFADAHAIDTINCLQPLLEGITEPWRIRSWDNEIRGICVKVATVGAEGERRVRELANWLISRGFVEYRNLVPDLG